MEIDDADLMAGADCNCTSVDGNELLELRNNLALGSCPTSQPFRLYASV